MYNKQRPLVTVVTSVDKGAPFLERVIAGVVTQTYQNRAYGILKSASPDSTDEIAAEFSGHDSRLSVGEIDG